MPRSLRYFWLALIVQLATFACHSWGQVTVGSLLCDRRHNPLAIDSAGPRLSWIVDSDERSQRQTGYRVLVASTAAGLSNEQGDLWDSGKVPSADSLDVKYAGRPLVSGQVCFWKVRVWDKNDASSEWSTPATWEMGLLRTSDWTGQWLSDGRANPHDDAAFFAEDPAPCFRKTFVLTKPVRRARLHITGLGYYEASLNGRRVGDQVLDPGWTKYDRRVYYSTFDVTEQVSEGDNCIGVMLGNGWYNPLPLRMWGHLNLRRHLTVGRPRFIAQLNIEFNDGSTESVSSDLSWKVDAGPIRFNSIYTGEIYDARLEQSAWDRPGFDDSEWHAPAIAAENVGLLQAQPQPPIRITERIAAVSVSQPREGVFIYDMGQNFAGWASFWLGVLPAGTTLRFRYGELLYPAIPPKLDGELNPMTSVCGQIKGQRKNAIGADESIGGPGAPTVAWQSDTYIAAGGREERYTPRFTFHGFRFVEVTGLPCALPLEAVTGLRLNTDVASVGSFDCSNERFRRIQQMCRRTFLSNMFSVQSDCPHRERFAYGGDIVATSEALMLNFDMSTFYAKTVQDWADSALSDGMFTDTAPFVGIQYCGLGWAMAHPLLLSQLHRYYGNGSLVAEHYEAAKSWLLLVAAANADGLIKEGLGDHEGLEPAQPASMVTPLYVQSARTLADMARLLHRQDDAQRFDALAQASCAAYQQNFLDSQTGKVGAGTQASQSIALFGNLVPEQDRDRVLNFLVENIRGGHNGHLSTGIIGTKCMLDVLSREGRAEVAYGIVNQAGFPGWGWMLENGATTLWEHWAQDDNTFSQSHPMFGSVSQWFINWLGGIQPVYEAAGFDQIVIRPQTVSDLNWVQCSYLSARGMITSDWRREGDAIQFNAEIPVGVSALVYVPARAADSVTESGIPLLQAPGVQVIRTHRGSVVCRVGSGRYSFTAPALQ